MRTHVRPTKLGLIIALSTVLTISPLLAAIARADGFTYDGQHFFFFMNGVPDFDQKRLPSIDGLVKGLPGGGNMHCAPASALNWMAYVANRGYPSVGPGPGNWEVSPPAFLDEYNFITGNIFLMGLLMHTDPAGGTGGKGTWEGMQQWLDTAAPGDFIVVGVFANEGWSPRVRDASLMSIFGGLVNVVMGWYTNADEPEAHMRKGGHVVTLVSGNNSTDDKGEVDDTYGGIGVNDPASGDDDNRVTQSPFEKVSSAFQSETEYFCWQDANGFPTACHKRTQDRLQYTNSGYLDGYFAIIPKYGLSFTASEILLYRPIQLSSREQRVVHRFSIPGGRNILDLALNPTRVRHPYLIEGSDGVWVLDLLTGESTEFARVKDPLRLTYGGPDENLYVLNPHHLECFDRTGRRTRNTGLQQPLDAIAFDEKNHRLVGLSRAARRIYLFDSSLRRLGSMPLPDGVLGDEGRLTLTINPASGEMWAHTDGARFASRLTTSESGEIRVTTLTLPEEIASPQGLYVDERGNLFVTGGGNVYPLDAEGRLRRSSSFFGLEAGRAFQTARPFTNFDPETMIGPSFVNVLPEDADRIVGN